MADSSPIKPYLRDPGGRFRRGTRGGPGRPRRAVERDYLLALSETCPPERWRRIVERAVELAEAGDTAARSWLARYLVGERSIGDAASPLEWLEAFESGE